MKRVVHYGLNQQELRAKYKSNGDFATAHDGMAPSCGNGSFHANSTRDKRLVTCAECKSKILRSN